MKRFEFKLARVLEYRQEEAGIERTRLASLLSQEKNLEEEKLWLRSQLAEARDEAIGEPFISGNTLETLSHYGRYVSVRSAQLDTAKAELQLKIRQQQLRVLEVERSVNLLLKLQEKKQSIWTREQERELEALAADSYMARLASERRASAELAQREALDVAITL